MANITVISTGGTIASTDGVDGVTPTESGEKLVASAADALNDIQLSVQQITQCPSPEMDFEILTALRSRVERAEADGIVITHGTDTIEESAYYLDITLADEGAMITKSGQSEKQSSAHTATVPPVVFTGAQRRPDQVSSDGPANLVTAVTAAADERFREAGGVYVALNDEVHAAHDVVKTHTWKLETMASPGHGPVAVAGPQGLDICRPLGSRSIHVSAPNPPTATVDIIQTGIGVNGRSIERAVADGIDGLVLVATGLGNAPKVVAEAVRDAVHTGVPVVITSRCYAGTVSPVYGDGGGQTLAEYGAIFAGDLSASKARVKLLLALSQSTDIEEVRAFFEEAGEG